MKLSELFRQAERETIEAWCRGKTQNAYLGKHNALCRVLGTFLMYVDTRDHSLTPHLLLNGYWEMWVTQAIANYVKPGMHCIDVGANVGYYTLLLSELVGEKGSVTAFEPQSGVYELLRHTIQINGFGGLTGRARCRSEALSDWRGRGMLTTKPTDLGAASLIDIGSNTQESVLITRLDTTRANIIEAPVDFVKIDAQSEELRILEGMQETIKASPKIAIAMEFTPRPAHVHQDLELIQSYGLKIQTIGHDGVVRPITLEQAAQADTGDHRMLWLTRADQHA